MAHLSGIASWPPVPIATERLVLRAARESDRARIIDLFSSSEVFAFLGGARARDELERDVPDVPGQRPGFFVVDLGGQLIGTVTLDRRDPERPGHVRAEGGEVEIGYLFFPEAWRHGYASEASHAVLSWVADALPREPVLLCTQTANTASMRLAAKLGFVEIERFEEYGAEQWLGMRSSR